MIEDRRLLENYLKKCAICPRECASDRIGRRGGFCKATDRLEVHAVRLHTGEEPPISGKNGSGTIFFNHCNLRCSYCQNYKFSQLQDGKEVTIERLSEMMLSLEERGAHNINFVTPTHYAVHVALAATLSKKKGLKIPVVYNTSGYEKIETLRLLSGLVDIYLTDMRYGSNESAKRYSQCSDYVEVNRDAVREMYRQVGRLKVRHDHIAERGIIIRHLILPGGVCGTEEVFRFISEELDKDIHISLMSQYYPAYEARADKAISRHITIKEYEDSLGLLRKYGLDEGWVQEYGKGKIDPGFAGTNIESGF
ncbi:MAG: radical SAM protein [Candidatus Omnitrophica bacterium]|nr:radical SAM protein [Candidatus Omnitrophota bacterium]